jgi:hypothetical protein
MCFALLSSVRRYGLPSTPWLQRWPSSVGFDVSFSQRYRWCRNKRWWRVHGFICVGEKSSEFSQFQFYKKKSYHKYPRYCSMRSTLMPTKDHIYFTKKNCRSDLFKFWGSKYLLNFCCLLCRLLLCCEPQYFEDEGSISHFPFTNLLI